MITLADLEGRWRLSREIEDRRAGVTGRLEGEAVWAKASDGLIQTETGLLHYGDAAPMQAERRYLWRSSETGLAVFFDDGRPFHEVDGTAAEATHFCEPDLYRVRYNFSAWPHWSSRWEVTGPRKDLTIATWFEPLVD